MEMKEIIKEGRKEGRKEDKKKYIIMGENKK